MFLINVVLSPLIPDKTLWATSKDRNKPTGNIVNSILRLMEKCSKVEALNLNEPKNPQRWDRFESILQNFIFVIQVISLLAIHGNVFSPIYYLKYFLVDFVLKINLKPLDEIDSQFFDDGKEFIHINGWYFENK